VTTGSATDTVAEGEIAMAMMRDRPYTNSNFLVEVRDAVGTCMTAGFAEVIFPRFTTGHGAPRRGGQKPSQSVETGGAAGGNYLVLTRGQSGDLDLYAWWHSARRARTAKPRTLKIELLNEDRSAVVLTWQFNEVYPVSLSYSPLRAMEVGVVMETVELAFTSVEMS
jgi:phage tail-like protein